MKKLIFTIAFVGSCMLLSSCDDNFNDEIKPQSDAACCGNDHDPDLPGGN